MVLCTLGYLVVVFATFADTFVDAMGNVLLKEAVFGNMLLFVRLPKPDSFVDGEERCIDVDEEESH
jgi:hypothetical protein